MDELTAMRVFARVADSGSFARAADGLGLSRTATSHYVAQLEKRLGARLLHRTTRRVTLSSDGARYLERCRRILAEVDAAREEVRGARERPQGKLRVDVPYSFGHYLLMPALPEFTRRYPELQLDIRFNDQYIDLEAEQVDVALRGGVSGNARLIARKVADTRRVTCASPRYLARAGAPRTPEELRTHKLVGFQHGRTGRPLEWQFRAGRGTRKLKLPFALTFNAPEAPILAALEGSGIIQSIDLLVSRLLKDGRLVEVLSEHSCAGAPLSVVYPPASQNSIKVRVFADFAAELLRDWQRGERRGNRGQRAEPYSPP
jgi:LysR family transcriptional regulator for bpeEF and oprC